MQRSPFEFDIVEARLELADLPSEIRPLFAYWRKQRNDRLMPSRAQIDPTDLRAMLRYTSLVEITPAPRNFLYRVIGTNLSHRPGGPRDRRNTTELRPERYRQMVERHYGEACDLRRPTLYGVKLSFKDVQLTYRRLILPLANDGANPNMLLIGSVFDLGENERFWRRYGEEEQRAA